MVRSNEIDTPVLEGDRWSQILQLLSLDGVIPFYEEMGLLIKDKQRFVQMLRGLIDESFKTCDPGRTLDISFAERVLREVEQVFGKATAEHLNKWATTLFSEVHQDQPHWSAWDDVLPRHPNQLPEGLESEQWAAIAKFRSAHRVDDIEQRVRAMRSQPLSNWDAKIYSINGYSNVEDPMFEDDFNDPYAAILGTVEMNRFQRSWPELWSHFTQNEKNFLWKYGKQIRRAEGLEKYDAGGLPHPDDLRRRI